MRNKSIIAVFIVPILVGTLLAVHALSAPSLAGVVVETANEQAALSQPLATCEDTFAVTVHEHLDGGVDALSSTNCPGYHSYYCENVSARPVYYGSRNTTSESTAPAICTTSSLCGKPFAAQDVGDGLTGFDIADGGTVSIKCSVAR